MLPMKNFVDTTAEKTVEIAWILLWLVQLKLASHCGSSFCFQGWDLMKRSNFSGQIGSILAIILPSPGFSFRHYSFEADFF